MAFCSFIFEVAYKVSEDVGEFGRDFVGCLRVAPMIGAHYCCCSSNFRREKNLSQEYRLNKRGIAQAWFVVP